LRFTFFIIFSTIIISTYANYKDFHKIDDLLYEDNILDINYKYPTLREFTNEQDSSLIIYIKDILNKNIEKDNNSVILKCLFILGQINLYQYNYIQADKYFNKALNKSKNNKESIAIIYKLSELKIKQEQYLKSIKYLKQIKLHITPNNNPNLYTSITLRKSFNYIKLEKYKLAEKDLNNALFFIEKYNLKTAYNYYYTYKGLFYYYQFDYLNTLYNFNKGLELFKQDTLIDNYTLTLKYIGYIYFNQENYKKALINFNNTLVIFDKLNDNKNTGITHLEIADCYVKTGDLNSAKHHLNKANRLFKKIDYKKGINATNIKYGQIYCLEYKIDSALSSLHKISINNLHKGLLNISKYEYYKQLTNCYLYENNLDSVIYFSNKAKIYCSDKTDIYQQIDCKIFIAKIMSATGDYMEAYKKQKDATSLINSLYKFINSYEINILQTKIDANSKQLIINTLASKCEVQHKTIKKNIVVLQKQKDYIHIGIIFFLFLIVLILLIIYHLHQKRKDNIQLRRKNIKIAQQKEEIEQQSFHLQKINEELEKLSLVAKETASAIKIIDRSGNIIWINDGYERMYGYTLHDLQLSNNNIEKLLGKQASINKQELLNTWYGDKQHITFESLNETKSGKYIWVNTVLTPILEESGKVKRMIVVDSNITRIKQVEQELLLKNENITASISYAKRIQEAMTTPFKTITKYYKNSYKFYKPKSIVSGDFYWTSYNKERLIITCADSTGHGVPGAFMSMIGISFLNKIVNEKNIISPDSILNRMRKNIVHHLHQNDNEIIAEDGFDMSVISIDTQNYKLEYAGAMNPIYIFRNSKLIELKADRYSISYFDNEDKLFSLKEIDIKKGDCIYMFTDGYYDQFGGDSELKMKGNRFREILKTASLAPFERQKNIIEDEFYKWKGEHPQIDDVLVICINID